MASLTLAEGLLETCNWDGGEENQHAPSPTGCKSTGWVLTRGQWLDRSKGTVERNERRAPEACFWET